MNDQSSNQDLQETASSVEEAVLSPFTMFGTDATKELEGIKIDYGPFWFHIMRAGGRNQRYAKVLTRKVKPHRRAIQLETIPIALATQLAIEVFVEGCLLNWGSTRYGDGVMIGVHGEQIPFSAEAAVKMMKDLPDLFADLKTQAESVSNFQDLVTETDVGNS